MKQSDQVVLAVVAVLGVAAWLLLRPRGAQASTRPGDYISLPGEPYAPAQQLPAPATVPSVEQPGWFERAGTWWTELMTDEPAEGSIINTQGTTRFIYEIPPGGKFNAEKHMYEEIFFVLKGRGATTVWVEEDGPRQTFEWKEGSVFSIPLNAYHEIYNGQGDAPARLYAATSAPTAFNLYASPEFVFDCPNTFPDRFNPTDETFFSGKATKLADRFMSTNFIPDVNQVVLDRWRARALA